MMYKSDDGIMSPSDPGMVATWNSIGKRMQIEQAEASRRLQEIGVRAEHPDDGWVNRDLNRVYLSYPRFDHGVTVGDLIALGDPRRGYRLVQVTRVETPRSLLIPMTYYYFKPYNDDFLRPGPVNKPVPVKKQRRIHRYLPRFK